MIWHTLSARVKAFGFYRKFRNFCQRLFRFFVISRRIKTLAVFIKVIHTAAFPPKIFVVKITIQFQLMHRLGHFKVTFFEKKDLGKRKGSQAGVRMK